MVTRILFSVGLSADGTVRRSLAGGGSARGVVSGLLVGTVVLTDPLMLGLTYFLPRTQVRVWVPLPLEVHTPQLWFRAGLVISVSSPFPAESEKFLPQTEQCQYSTLPGVVQVASTAGLWVSVWGTSSPYTIWQTSQTARASQVAEPPEQFVVSV